jgi:hypothetical protein
MPGSADLIAFVPTRDPGKAPQFCEETWGWISSARIRLHSYSTRMALCLALPTLHR